ncbi:hypothetical protein PanWU01x14_211710, partial [Parasponia andersonii]
VIPTEAQVQDSKETLKLEATLGDLDKHLATQGHVAGPNEISCDLRLCPKV